MRTELVEYKIYKFSELSEEVQNKVLEQHRDWNTEGFDWWDSVYETAYDDLKQAGFEDCKIWFSGFSSQGDGACFDCKRIDLERLIDALKGRIDDKRWGQYKRFIPKLDVGIEIRALGHHYSHERTRKIDVEGYIRDKCHRSAALVNQFTEDLEELRYDMAHKIYQDLEKEYEWLTSDEQIKESLEANQLEFLEDGKIFN